MNKSSNLSVRIDPKLKDEAEETLNTLGISLSNAINIFFKQVILHKGLPFEVKIPNCNKQEKITKEDLIKLFENK